MPVNLKRYKSQERKYYMLPFKQGGLDSLCGIYSIINAERKINNSPLLESKELFNKAIDVLSEESILASILKEGMLLKHIKLILNNVVGDRIPYKKINFQGVSNPSLNTFWEEISDFINEQSNRAVLLGMSGMHDHWTTIRQIHKKQILFSDSDRLHYINRINCTTSYVKGSRHHILCPAQTYFLGNL